MGLNNNNRASKFWGGSSGLDKLLLLVGRPTESVKAKYYAEQSVAPWVWRELPFELAGATSKISQRMIILVGRKIS